MIEVQILEYVYGTSGQNLINLNNATFNTSATYPWKQLSSTSAKIVNQATGAKYLSPVTGLMTKGKDYTISATVVDYTGSGGDIGFSSVDTSGAGNGVGGSARRSSNGSISHTFSASGFQNVKIFSGSNGGGTLTNMKLIPVSSVEWEESIVGALDVGSSEDFPLALTFSIADARNLDNRTGTYSKSFNIPATKNNNRILKTSYNPGSITSSSENIHTTKPCRIIVDGVYSITGLFQLTAVGQSSSPSYYSCVFYGDNVSWASSIDTKLLRNLAVRGGSDGSGWDLLNGKIGTGLELTYASITAAWDAVNATDTMPYGGVVATNTTPVVYPNCSYGDKNETGECKTQQLLKTATEANGWSATKTGNWGWDGNGNPYGTPEPTLDWRPGIFIYDIIKQIFAQEGYNVSSLFMETPMFKSLIMLLPNFRYSNTDFRVNTHSAGGTFIPIAQIKHATDLSPVLQPASSDWTNHTLRFNLHGAYNENNVYDNTIYDDSTGYFTTTEAGFYDISAENLGVSIKTMCDGTATNVKLAYVKLNLEIQTKGESSWNKLIDSYAVNNVTYPDCSNFNHSGAPDSPPNTHDFPILSTERRFLNKGDKVRFLVKVKTTNVESTAETIGYDMTFWGGSPYQYQDFFNTWYYGAGSEGAINFQFHGEEGAFGQTYDLKNVIDTESTQMGFIKGIIHCFNLYMTTNVANKTVYIEPFDDFFEEPNSAVDWTGKVDLSQNQEDKWVESDLSREVIFKYKSDSSDKVVENKGIVYWDGVLDTYPYREFLGSDYKTGVTKFENPFFAGTWDANDGDIASANGGCQGRCPVVPSSGVLWGECDGNILPRGCGECRPPKGNNFLPRILTYLRDDSSPTGSSSRWYTEVELWTNQRDFITTGIPTAWSGATINYPIMARAFCVDSKPNMNNITPVLTYGTVRRSYWNPASPNSNYTMSYYKGLYQTYYEKMMDMLRTTNRIKIIYLNLRISDIMNLDLKKLVYIDGYYYRINRVIDYQPNNNNTTQVELLLWKTVGTKVADAAPGFENPWT
tara:strand:- start:735 stop:3827 length:3093 start_codon:yes stop_codon:yes gene_type:complete